MRVIYKFKLKIEDEQFIDIPANPRIISVKQQRGELYI